MTSFSVHGDKFFMCKVAGKSSTAGLGTMGIRPKLGQTGSMTRFPRTGGQLFLAERQLWLMMRFALPFPDMPCFGWVEV